MIRCTNKDDVSGETVNLQQQRRHDTFDLTRFMGVGTLFGYGVEFVEEQYTASGASKLKCTI